MMEIPKWSAFVDTLPISPLFITVSGAHLYGFPSHDSDVDLRGCHQLPLRDVVGLSLPNQTYQYDGFHDGIETDIVSHEIGKYLNLLTRNNGYVLEQIFSPLVVRGESFLAELRPLAKRCVTRHHFHHYRGFYATQRRLLDKENLKRVKSVLYAYRVLLTGIHLMRSGNVEANILLLNEDFQLPYIEDLVASKSAEKIAHKDFDWPFHAKELDRLEATLADAFNASSLTEERDRAAINDFLVRLRIGK